MDPLVSRNLGFILALSELAPQPRNCLIQHATDSQIDTIATVTLNVVFENIKLQPGSGDKLSRFAPLLMLLSDRSKGRQLKKSTLMRYPRFITVLFKAVRADIIEQIKNQ